MPTYRENMGAREPAITADRIASSRSSRIRRMRSTAFSPRRGRSLARAMIPLMSCGDGRRTPATVAGLSSTAGFPSLVIVTTSPAIALSISSDKRAFASAIE